MLCLKFLETSFYILVGKTNSLSEEESLCLMKTYMQTENMIVNYRYKAECEGDDVLILCVLTRNKIQMFSNFYLFPFLLCFITLFFQT